MASPISSDIQEHNDTMEEDIISSLKYLHQHCHSKELRSVIKIALDLCYSTLQANPALSKISVRCEQEDSSSPKNLLNALQYLKEEASRNQLDDIEMILEAASKLCFVMLYLQLRNEYQPANLLSAV